MEKSRQQLFKKLRKDVGDDKIIEAMQAVPRELFVPNDYRYLAYEDVALPIDEGQTISQPYIVAAMVSALELRRTDRVLEVGTGSGYQAAILARLAREVVTVERIEILADQARARLHDLGCANVTVHLAGEELGWPEQAPYDAIIVAAAAPKLPTVLQDQLAQLGRMIVPVGQIDAQDLVKVTRTRHGLSVRTFGGCKFVPLIGQDAWPKGSTGL